MKRLFLALTVCGSLIASAHASTSLDSIAAVVNTEIVLASELDNAVEQIKLRAAASNSKLPDDAALRPQVLEQVIVRKLQLQQAQKTGIRVSDETLNNAMQQIAKQNKMTLDEFRQAVAAKNIDFAQFREDKRSEMIIGRLQQREVIDPIVVTDQEVDLFMSNPALKDSDQEFRLGHILVSLPEAPNAEQIAAAKTKADALVAKLRAGANFTETAISSSDGQQALQGGDLGWRKAAQLPTLFADAATKLKTGEISDPIRSSSGFHIVTLLEKRGSQEALVTESMVRHILIQPSEVVSDDAAHKKADELYQQIKAGKDFAELAQSNSSDPGSASRGGSLGWVTPGQMVPEFEEAIDKLKPGEVSEPFHSQFGWHIAKVEERRQQDRGKEQRREQVRQLLHDRKASEATEVWVRKLRDESYVEVRK